MIRILQLLLATARASLRSRRSLVAENILLQHQLQIVLRGRPRPALLRRDKLLLVLLRQLCPRWRQRLVVVTPQTVLGWHRDLVRRRWAAFSRRAAGRPPLDREVRELICQMAAANPRWGYLRIRGELGMLGHQVAASTISSILRRQRIPPAPRRSGPGWREFLAAHASTIVATDFLAIDTLFLKRIFILFFIHLESRRILFATCTEHPTAEWVTQQARHLTWEMADLGITPRFLIRDRDSKFSATFDTVLIAEGARIVRTPFRSPLANSVAERWCGSARRECLDWMIVLGQRHLQSILREFVSHYNHARPHRSLALMPPAGLPSHREADGPIVVTSRLGGLLREYSRQAA